MTEESILESTVMTFIKNRSEQNESTASRHIHRRFDIPMDAADRILAKLAEKKMISRKQIFNQNMKFQSWEFSQVVCLKG